VPVAQETTSNGVRIVSARRVVPNFLCKVESSLLVIAASQFQHPGPNLCTRDEQVNRLGRPCNQAVHLVDDDLLDEPEEAIVGGDVRWEVWEVRFDVLLTYSE
jgi:hypothetical protein